MKKTVKFMLGSIILTTVTLFNLKSNSTNSISAFDSEIEALACGENGCTKDYSKVSAEEYGDGAGVVVVCSGCGSLKCTAPKGINTYCK